MKREIVFIAYLIINISAFSQIGYKYKSEFIKLEVDSFAYFIQTNEQNAIEKNESLDDFIKSGDRNSFTKLAENRFLVFGKDINVERDDYFSNLYKTGEHVNIIILPRIVLKLKNGQTIDSIIKIYSEQISIEENNGNKIVLKCLLNNSESVLRLNKELNNLNEIEWCEPEMLSNFSINNPLYSQQYYLKNTGQNGGISDISSNARMNIRTSGGDVKYC